MPLSGNTPSPRPSPLNMDRRRQLIFVGLTLIMCLPVVASIWMTQAVVLDQIKSSAAERARATAERADGISMQLRTAIEELTATGGSSPCSPIKLLRMRQLILRMNLLSDVGYVQGDTLVCSALGNEPMNIGPPSYTSNLGYVVRLDVPYAFAPEARFIVSTGPSSGYSGIINKDTVFGTPVRGFVSSVDLVGITSGRSFATGTPIPRDWFNAIRSAPEGQLIVQGDVLAWHKNARYDYAAYTVISAATVLLQFKRVLLFVVPGSIFLSALLCWCTLLLVRLQTSMRTLIKTGLKRAEFFVLYQPIVDMRDGKWVGAEALLRWRRATGEVISPDIFIPIAEKSGLMNKVTAQVLDRVENDARLLCASHKDFFISINFSAEDFASPDQIERVKTLIARTGLAPANFHIEATERIFLDPQTTHAGVAALHDMGVEVAIDDFGTGFSGLAYLTNIRMDCLKIDKCFVQTAGTPSVTTNVVSHIINLATSLDMEMIAEGVETAEQARYLQERGVQMAQGWLYGKPIAAQEFSRRMQGAPRPAPSEVKNGG